MNSLATLTGSEHYAVRKLLDPTGKRELSDRYIYDRVDETNHAIDRIIISNIDIHGKDPLLEEFKRKESREAYFGQIETAVEAFIDGDNTYVPWLLKSLFPLPTKELTAMAGVNYVNYVKERNRK